MTQNAGTPGIAPGGRAYLLATDSGGTWCFAPGEAEVGIMFCRESAGQMQIVPEQGAQVSGEPRSIWLVTGAFTLKLPRTEEQCSVVVQTGRGNLPIPEGCCRLKESLWSHTLFDTLNCLAREDLCTYCAWKAEELLYLLARGGLALAAGAEHSGMGLHHIHLAQQGDAYIRTHIHEDLSIETVARVLHTSPTTLKRCYRQAFGVSFHQAVTRYRMDRAVHLLRTTALTVRDVAAEVGYDSVSQFSTVFQRSTGQTPARYRNAKKV